MIMKERLLIVDDSKLIRATTRVMFEEEFEVLEASNGNEALTMIDENIDIILLDLYMPTMGGIEVIQNIKAVKKLEHIPIIIITSSENVEDQLKAFEMGVNDYITKPIIPEIAIHRVKNIVESNKRMLKIMEERKLLIMKAEMDGLTGVYNKTTTVTKIEEILKRENDERYALFVFDIDFFKAVNDQEGHLAGDQTLKEVADLISSNFKNTDIVGRIGGDEFVTLMCISEGDRSVENKANDLIRLMNNKSNLQIPEKLTLSIGIAFTDENCMDYNTLFKKADEALYVAKKNGRNTYYIYDKLND